MSSGGVPFHETGQPSYGVSEDCRYNDHGLCRNPRCGCSCHRKAPVVSNNADTSGSSGDVRGSSSNYQGLDKYCPKCKVKAASEQNYCTVDGAKLSSLRCPECGTPGEQSHTYCGYCGHSMKVEDSIMEAAATGSGITEDSAEVSTDNDDAEAAMRAALGIEDKKVDQPVKVAKRIPAPVSPVISSRMFK